jgi:PST family polysaccharide transporter
VVAPWLLRTLYGEAFASAGIVAQVHLVSVVFVSISVARGRVLVIHGLTRFAMCTALIGGAVNIVLNVVLIPQWGPIGAAIATVATHAMAAVGSTLLYKPTRALGMRQVQALLRPRVQLAG